MKAWFKSLICKKTAPVKHKDELSTLSPEIPGGFGQSFRNLPGQSRQASLAVGQEAGIAEAQMPNPIDPKTG